MEVHPYKTTSGFKVQLKMTENEINENSYLDGGIWTKETETIIMGTFPPKTEYFNRVGYIHYSSPRNKFWKHIDAIYNTNLYINSKDANDNRNRIENSKQKIDFIKSKKVGFIDIFTMVNRVNNDAKDLNLIPIESIFDTEIFKKIIENNIRGIIFVYSLCMDTFFDQIKERYNASVILVRPHGKDGIPLTVYKTTILNNTLHLIYAPIHGNNTNQSRRTALKKAIEFEF